MAKSKRSKPVAPPKKDPNRIVIRQEDLPKERRVHAPPTRYHENRERDLRRGNRRHPKHRKGLGE